MAPYEWTPSGSQTRSKQWKTFGGSPFPQFLTKAYGAIVWDDAGQPYIDWIAGLGAVGLGYRHHEVDRAVMDQIAQGVTFSLPTKQEERTAKVLCGLLEWPDQVRWVKTGSEATAAAMLIARRATGRQLILSIGYHGWHETHRPGPNLVDIPWGEPSWEHHLDSRVAAVILEPMRDRHPPEKYLFCIQSRCRAVGALFILDEMLTGFRWAIGGASEYYRIVPDLACYGKALGNGYPIAGVVGRRHLMSHAEAVSSTFGGECVGLKAAQATMTIYAREKVCDRMWELGRRLLQKCPALSGWPVHPRFAAVAGWGTERDVSVNVPSVQAAAARGHLIHPSGFNIMAAHTEADVDALVEAING